jgi:hypothetical protein
MNWKSIIEADFSLSAQQMAHFEALDGLYREWNAQINVISRKDIVLYNFSHALTISSRLVVVVFSEMAMVNPLVSDIVSYEHFNSC